MIAPEAAERIKQALRNSEEADWIDTVTTESEPTLLRVIDTGGQRWLVRVEEEPTARKDSGNDQARS